MLLLSGQTAVADQREDYLVGLLGDSDAFRVRVQAALSLGQVPASPRTLLALQRAVTDRHPAVRVAVVTALERLGSPRTLKALRRASKDKVSAVRRAAKRAIAKIERAEREAKRGGPRYYVSVGRVGSKSRAVSAGMRTRAKAVLAARVSELEGVELAPDGQSRSGAQDAISERKLKGYAVEASVVKVENHPQGKRVVMSMMLTTYPGRELRATLRGSAIASDGVWPAVEGAIEGVLRRLPAAIRGADTRPSL